MIALRTLLKGKGLITFDDLLIHCGPEAADELFEMVENREVSSHTEPMGGINYRYPYYSVKVIGNQPSKALRMLYLIQENPGLNGVSIKKTLKASQSSFERWEKELLSEVKITRVKKGAAWLYYPIEAEVTEKVKVPKGAYYIWFEYMQADSGGKSLQQLAKDFRCSREVITEGHRWMVDQGILVGEELVGYKAMTPEQRKKWLREFFPRRGGDEVWDDETLDWYASDEKVGVLQSRSPAVDKLGQLIIEVMKTQPEWTSKEIMVKIPVEFHSSNEDNCIVNPVVKKLIQLSKDGIINRQWDGDEDVPAIYSLPKNAI